MACAPPLRPVRDASDQAQRPESHREATENTPLTRVWSQGRTRPRERVRAPATGLCFSWSGAVKGPLYNDQVTKLDGVRFVILTGEGGCVRCSEHDRERSTNQGSQGKPGSRDADTGARAGSPLRTPQRTLSLLPSTTRGSTASLARTRAGRAASPCCPCSPRGCRSPVPAHEQRERA